MIRGVQRLLLPPGGPLCLMRTSSASSCAPRPSAWMNSGWSFLLRNPDWGLFPRPPSLLWVESEPGAVIAADAWRSWGPAESKSLLSLGLGQVTVIISRFRDPTLCCGVKQRAAYTCLHVIYLISSALLSAVSSHLSDLLPLLMFCLVISDLKW